MKGSSGKLRTAAYAAGLFALNAYITLRLFHTDYTRQMGSIEAAYIGLARYIAKHLGELSWFPLWYGGIPYADTYPPLLHMVCGLVVAVAGVSPGLALPLRDGDVLLAGSGDAVLDGAGGWAAIAPARWRRPWAIR